MACKRVRLAVFDVDGVLVPIRSSWEYVHKMLGVVKEAKRNYQLAVDGKIGYWEWMYLDTLLWVEANPGITRWDLERMFENVEPFREAYEAVRLLKRHGVIVALLSGGVDVLVSRVAAKLKVDYWVANRLAFDAKGRLIPGGYALVEAYRKDKALRKISWRLGVPLSATAYIGDSRWDLEAMKEACLSIAVNTSDDVLVRYADYSVENVLEAAKIIVENYVG